MAYKRRIESKVEVLAAVRLNALKNFDSVKGSAIDFGSSGKSLTSTDFEGQINLCKSLRDDLNTTLENADGKVNDLKSAIRKLSNMNTEVLSGVRSKFGVDSTEYEQAGGTRQSERKRPKRKSKTTQP